MKLEAIREATIEEIIKPVLPKDMIKGNINFLVNPTGRFVGGGPQGDCGLTGRKIIVDTYGGSAPHGGGAFSGKDPSKVDRSAASGARYGGENGGGAGPGAEGPGHAAPCGGGEPEFTWENTDKALALAADAGIKKGSAVTA